MQEGMARIQSKLILYDKLESSKSTLNTGQTEAFNSLIKFIEDPDKRMFTLAGYAGTGKELANSEIVLTPSGWEQIGDLKVGDKVNVPYKGRISNVDAVYPQGIKDIYRITFDDSSYVDAGLEHQWKVQTPKQVQNGNYWIRTTRELIKDYWKQDICGRYRYSIDLVDEVNFEEQAISLNPYLIGFLLGDGYLDYQSQITAKNNGEEKYQLLIDKIPYDVYLKYDKRNHHLNFSIELGKYLRILGLYGVRSKDKFIPKEYLHNTADIRKGILAGLLDSDGTVDSASGRTRFISTSKQLRNDVVELVKSLGGSATIYESHREYNNKPTEYITNIRLKFNPFILSYKKKNYSTNWKVFFKKRIVCVELVRKEKATCITVSDRSSLFITRGYTITHNTYVISRFLEATGGDVAASAPTNKAVRVLRTSSLENTRIEFSTIHKLLALKVTMWYPPKGSNALPKQVLRKNKWAEPTISHYDIVIIDESSMLTDEIFLLVNKIARGAKVIFMGDQAQIPPVGKDDSLVLIERKEQGMFNLSIYREESISDTGKKSVMFYKRIYELGKPIPKEIDIDGGLFTHKAQILVSMGYYTLTQSMRQKEGSGILKTANSIRDNRWTSGNAIKDRTDMTDLHFYSTSNPVGKLDFMRQMFGYFCSKTFQENSDYVKVLAWRNKTVNGLGLVIRKQVFKGQKLSRFMVGEKLIVSSPIIKSSSVLFNTSDEITVQSVTVGEEVWDYPESKAKIVGLDLGDAVSTKKKKTFTIKYWELQVTMKMKQEEDEDVIFDEKIIVLHEDTMKVYESLLVRYAYIKDWKGWNALKETYAQVAYNYCITVHKAQGSSYEHVFVIEDDIDANFKVLEKNRIKYTAVSRASKSLHILTRHV